MYCLSSLVSLSVFLTLFFPYCTVGRNLDNSNEITNSAECKMNNKWYNVGEKWSVLGECNIYTCQKGGGISALTCSEFTFPPGSTCYKSRMDLTKHYPKCCPQPICPDEASNH